MSLRIGVVGHRRYDDPDATLVAIDAVIDRIVSAPGPTVISNLAEGADRVVVHRLLAHPGARLEAILPLHAADYRIDFDTATSAAEFDDLLQRAADVHVVDVPPEADREHCYEAAARLLIERSDVLMAVWDGQASRGRGGTADSVRYALDHEVPVEMIMVSRGGR